MPQYLMEANFMIRLDMLHPSKKRALNGMHHAVPLPFWMLQSKHISTWTCILDILNESLFVSGKEAVGSFGAKYALHSSGLLGGADHGI